ncbi:MAG: TonB-dependent receptor plug domain-containing protein [Sulfuricurvum sp.]
MRRKTAAPFSLMAMSLVSATYLCAADQNDVLGHLSTETFISTVSLEELGELVITDTKTEQSSRSVTQGTYVLTQHDFERLNENHRNIAELLQYTSGQFVNVLSRNDANWGSYAGLGPKYNTYMLDGLPIDSFVDAMSLDPWAFERVEVQKGPASVLYSNYMSMDFSGNEAPLAGTTNFILKEKIDSQMSRAQLGYGSYGTLNTRVYHQNRIGDLSYFLGANVEKSDYTRYGEPNSWLNTTENPDYRKSKIYGKLSYATPGDGTLSLFFQHTDHNGDMGRPYRDFSHDYDTLNFKFVQPLGDTVQIQLHAGLRDNDRMFTNDTATYAFLNTESIRQKIIPADIAFNYFHGSNGVLSVGSDAQWTQYRYYKSNLLQTDVDAFSNSFYLQEKWGIGDWIFRAGARHNTIRHDYRLTDGTIPAVNKASWSKTLWSLGVRWNPSSTFSWYANSGTSYMVPSAKQVGGTVGQLPNPSLRNELGLGNDMGIEFIPYERMKITLRAFYNVVDDAIVDDLTTTSSFNAGKMSARGAELAFSQKISDETDYFANVTYCSTKLKDPRNSDHDGSDIVFVPQYVANAGINTVLFSDLSASFYLQQVGRYYDSPSLSGRKAYGNYTVLNAKLIKPLQHTASYRLNALFDLNNLGNNDYSMPWNFVDPGFSAMASLQMTF